MCSSVSVVYASTGTTETAMSANGKYIRPRAYAIVDRPVELRAVVALMAMGVIVPLATGGVDLILRSITR
jgi:hypothetical protein